MPDALRYDARLTTPMPSFDDFITDDAEMKPLMPSLLMIDTMRF